MAAAALRAAGEALEHRAARRPGASATAAPTAEPADDRGDGEREHGAGQGEGAERDAVDLVLGHAEPYPALVVDRHWQLVRADAGLGLLLDGVDPALLVPPVNVLRVSLHPQSFLPADAETARLVGAATTPPGRSPAP